MSKVFLALQKTNETHGLVEAILADNPHAEYEDHPGMIKINAEKSMVVKRETVEEQLVASSIYKSCTCTRLP